MIHGKVGGLDQHVEILFDRRGPRDPAAGPTGKLAPIDDERLLQRRNEALCQQHAGGRLGSLRDKRTELVAAEPGNLDTRARHRPDALGHRLQQPVAHLVPVHVVDGLEVIEIDEEQRRLRIGHRHVVENLREEVTEGGTVEEAGERIVVGKKAELVLGMELPRLRLPHLLVQALRLALPGIPFGLELALAGELRRDPGERHGEIDGLGHVVVGTKVQALDDILALAPGADHDHRQFGIRIALADGLQDGVAADIRHHDVEQDQVEGLGLDQRQRVAPAGRLHGLEAAPGEPAHQDIAIVGDVVDNEDARRLLGARHCRFARRQVAFSAFDCETRVAHVAAFSSAGWRRPCRLGARDGLVRRECRW